MKSRIQDDSSVAGYNHGPFVERGAEGRVSWHGLEEHRGILRSHLKSRCSDENDINDIIQESFLRAARYRSGPMESGRLRGWLLRIASNVHVDKMRCRARSPTVGLDLEIWENIGECVQEEPRFCWGGGELELGEALDCLHRAKTRLRTSDQAVLGEFYAERSSTPAIARRLGISPGMVKVRLFRARRRLRFLVEQQFRWAAIPPFVRA
ncbi:MAG: RNA polymerase sigma factor [bacterium]|nr:RNA polymerase sigma factor [bacterium]